MEHTTWLGIVLGFGSLLLGFGLEGMSYSKLVGLSAAIIVLGGTFGAVMTSFTMKEVLSIWNYFMRALKPERVNLKDTIHTFISFSEKARREGLLALEEDLETIDDPFLRRGLQLVIDATDPEVIKEIMSTDMAKKEEYEKVSADVFEQLGGYSPTMGIVGTVMGLIGAVSNLNAGPDVLGENIATAFIATMYGVSVANLVFLPIANKLRVFNQQLSSYRELIVTGVLSLQEGDSPRIVQEKLIVFVEDEKEREEILGGRE